MRSRDGLRLHQIELAVQERAQRELAGLAPVARRRRSRLRTIACEHDGAAVRADLDDVLAGVGVRRREARRDDLVDGARAIVAVDAAHARECGVARLERRSRE